MFEYFQNATRVRVMLVGTCASQYKMLVKLVYEFVLLVNYVARARVAKVFAKVLPSAFQIFLAFQNVGTMPLECKCYWSRTIEGGIFPVALKCTSN